MNEISEKQALRIGFIGADGLGSAPAWSLADLGPRVTAVAKKARMHTAPGQSAVRSERLTRCRFRRMVDLMRLDPTNDPRGDKRNI